MAQSKYLIYPAIKCRCSSLLCDSLPEGNHPQFHHENRWYDDDIMVVETIPKWVVYVAVYQWPFQEPKLEVPTIYKAYFSGLCKGIYPQNMAWKMVQYLQFRILK